MVMVVVVVVVVAVAAVALAVVMEVLEDRGNGPGQEQHLLLSSFLSNHFLTSL